VRWYASSPPPDLVDAASTNVRHGAHLDAAGADSLAAVADHVCAI
jgi:hypothetical protein